MKTNKLYKLIVPLLFLAGSIGVAWGQEENPGKVKYGGEATVNDSETEIKIQSLTTTTETQSGNNINLECLWKYDNEYQWWAADEFGAVTFDIKPASYANIDKIFIQRGSKQEEQPVKVTFTYTDIGNVNVTKEFTVKRGEQIEAGSSIEDNMLLILDTPIKGASKLSIILTPQNPTSDKIALNKIRFYGKEFEISHKTTKWKNMRSSYSQDGKKDTFDDETDWFISTNSSVAEDRKMQPAHHYTDTIYMQKGDTHTLILPDKHSTQDAYASINNKSYRRWYNYRTDGDCSDLLKPIAEDPATYKIENGYLNLPYLEKNNDKIPYKMEFTYPENGEDSYIIACDVSNYLDLEFPNEEEEEGMILKEPTLSHRVLFYIKAIPDNMETDYYHETYDISFPFTRISNHTLDLVALSKNASAYAFSSDDNSGLTVKITGENTARIKLAKPYGYTGNWFTINDDGTTATLSGDHRIISFAYPNKRADDTQYVGPQTDDGETDNYTATIEVTKTVGTEKYKIATYNLTFKRNTVLLTQSIIEELEAEEGGDGKAKPWDGYKFRTPKALQDNYDQPLRELNWDYDPIEIDGYNEDYYPYPMDWSYSTYGFFDGSKDNGIIASTQNPPYPEWGHYGITSGYIETFWGGSQVAAPAKKLMNSNEEESSFHLYVDASDRPGTIARLELPGGLCNGSEIIVSAWVKSAASWEQGGNQDDASALFTIMGVKDGVRTPLYRHCTGQIRNTLYMSDNIPGCGSGSNEWLQVYFSFINEAAPDEYDEYLIQIDNYSASSNGADVYFDDIRCYVAKPQPRVTQQKLTCGERTRVRMDLNWAELISRLGLVELTGDATNTNYGIDFCFIDAKEYQKTFESNGNDIEAALNQAAVSIGREGSGYNEKYATLYYDLNYEKNNNYGEKIFDPTNDASGSLAVENEGEDGRYFFYRDKAEGDNYYEEGERLLSVDFFVDMSQGRDYWILIHDHDDENDGNASIFSLFGNPEDDCAIKAEFQVEGQSLIKMNGVVYNPKLEYCAGQIFNFTVDMRYYDESTKQETSYDGTYGPIYYDWFFGTQTEFEETQVENYDMTLAEALQYLRTVDPDASASDPDENGKRTLVRTNETAITDSEKGDVTEKVKGVIEHYLNEDPEVDGLRYRLELYRSELEIRILEDGLDLMVAPIARTIGTEGNQIQLCFEPIPFELEASNHAPKVQAGFPNMNYPNEEYNPAMRIGLQQIITSSGNEGTPITINLRNAEFAFDKEEYGTAPDYIGLRHIGSEGSEDLDHNLYLTASNDPALQDIFKADEDEDGFDPERYVIGRAETLCADPDAEGGAGTMTVKFKYNENIDETDEISSPKFEPREGYYYTFMVRLEGHNENHDVAAEKETCWGNLMIMMKVVPEYLVWQGNEYGDNWNNDSHWKRATNDDIQATNTITTYGDGYDNRGYVPMLFSKVIIPENGRVELYKAGFEEENGKLTWKTTINDPDLDHMEPPADVKEDVTDKEHPIQYDMMVYTKYKEDGSIESMSTKPYRPNLVDKIHFEPGAEMLHAELLTYNKAWVDYKLASEQWYTLASPLQGVVAGDFYTDSETGTEEQEYFSDIYFDDSKYTDSNKPNGYDKDNSRIKPSVYQRGWKGETNMVSTGEPNNVAVAGNWSAVYNNVEEKYEPGTGFSLKVLDMPENSNTEAIFRLPKNDDSYSYYDSEGKETETSASPITREGVGKLQISSSEETTTDDEELFTVSLTANGDYYLVGNPFMAYLDAKAFFTENSSNLGSSYWYADNGVQNIVSVAEGSLISTTEANTNIPPLRSFFVKKANDATSPVTVTFKKDMQVLGETSNEGTNTNALILTAKTADGKVSRAAIAYDMSANKDYAADEDAELFLDSNLSDVPAIYTVAGTMATSINRTSELYNIPVGIYGHSTEMVTLSFEGLKHFSSATLYDAEKKTETPLREGTTLTLPASTSGRYFLRAGAPTANESIATDAIQIYTLSGNRVMVTSTAPLKDIRVYTISGALVKQAKGGFCSHELYLPEDGIYVISAKSANGAAQTAKVAVN